MLSHYQAQSYLFSNVVEVSVKVIGAIVKSWISTVVDRRKIIAVKNSQTVLIDWRSQSKADSQVNIFQQ